MSYYPIFFAVMGAALAVMALFVLYKMGRWFQEHATPAGSVVFVLAGSLAFYCLYLGWQAAFRQEFELNAQPAFLLVPIALGIAAAMHLMRKRKPESTT